MSEGQWSSNRLGGECSSQSMRLKSWSPSSEKPMSKGFAQHSRLSMPQGADILPKCFWAGAGLRKHGISCFAPLPIATSLSPLANHWRFGPQAGFHRSFSPSGPRLRPSVRGSGLVGSPQTRLAASNPLKKEKSDKMQNQAFQDTSDSYYNQEKQFLFHLIPNGPNVVLDPWLCCWRGGKGALLRSNMAVEVIGVEIFEQAAEEAKKHWQTGACWRY